MFDLKCKCHPKKKHWQTSHLKIGNHSRFAITWCEWTTEQLLLRKRHRQRMECCIYWLTNIKVICRSLSCKNLVWTGHYDTFTINKRTWVWFDRARPVFKSQCPVLVWLLFHRKTGDCFLQNILYLSSCAHFCPCVGRTVHYCKNRVCYANIFEPHGLEMWFLW